MRLKLGAGIFIAITVLCIALPFFLEGGESVELPQRLLSPSLAHPFGTDTLGRDVLERSMIAGRNSLAIGALASLSSTAIAFALALLAMTGRIAELVVMRIADALKALPTSLLAILLTLTLGGGMWSLTAALCLVSIPQGARLIHSCLKSLKAEPFIEAERALGRKRMSIMLTTVIPHIAPGIALQALFVFSSAIMAEAGLSFIGAGLESGSASWGAMLSEGRSVIHQGWWLVLFPSLMVFLSVFSLHMIASCLRQD